MYGPAVRWRWRWRGDTLTCGLRKAISLKPQFFGMMRDAEPHSRAFSNASGHTSSPKDNSKREQQIVFTFLHFHLGHPFALSSILLLPSFTVDLMCFPWGTSRGVKRVSERTQNCKTNPRDITCVACIIYVACVLCALCAVCAARVCVCAVCVEQSNRTVALLVLCRAICHALARAALECPGGDTADDARLGRPRPRIPRHHLGMQ